MREVVHRGAKANIIAEVSEYFYQLVGEGTVLEAIWAYINSTEVRKNGYTHKSLDIHLETKMPYKRFTKRLKSGLYENRIIHPAAIATWPASNFLVITEDGSDDVPKGFYERLSLRMRVPMLPEWASALWQAGRLTRSFYGQDYRRDTLISKRSGDQATGWYVKAGDTEMWERIIVEHVKSCTREANAWRS